MEKRVLVTGANGQLGKSLQKIAGQKGKDCKFFFTDVDTLDITMRDDIAAFVKAHGVNVIVNVAAYTAVDKAEEEVEKAYLLNQTAVANLAAVAAATDAFLVHISTDYVFDGQAVTPYSEEMAPNPVSVYGKSKWAGEQAMIQSGCRGVIIRTAWLYSPYGNNFVKTMLRLASSHSEINVVDDQIGCPTSADDLAEVIMRLIARSSTAKNLEIYHFANKGKISWYDFACEIMKLAHKKCKVNPIATKDYPSKVQRPAYSVFNLSKVEDSLNYMIPDWNESLKRNMPEIIYNFEHDIK